MLKNLLKVFKSKVWIIWFIVWVAIILWISYYFINKELIIGNLWYNYYLMEISLTYIIAILFGLFLWASLYKIKYFSIWDTTWWIIGAILWVLVTWCPACSITLASYLWLISFVSILPFGGMELKILSVIILLWVNYDILKNLEVCKIKNER